MPTQTYHELAVQSFGFERERPRTSVWGVLISSLPLSEQERQGQHPGLNFCWDNAIPKPRSVQTPVKACWCATASEKTDGATVIPHCPPVRNGGNGKELQLPALLSRFQDQEVRTEVHYTTATLAEPCPQTYSKAGRAVTASTGHLGFPAPLGLLRNWQHIATTKTPTTAKNSTKVKVLTEMESLNIK